ncbi:hypothetical protein RJT34_19819 [Clitoria ternatea]|uniref:Uncharacterized protein n=1 Tax=Clitoria ternatea TaxID=43366 RepID=A0AAN9IS17_CLITE
MKEVLNLENNKDKKTTMLNLIQTEVQIEDLPEGEFILVEVDHLGNPMGWEGKTLLNAIGSLVRRHQCAPINYISWKDMPESYIVNMFELIQSKFRFIPKLTEQTREILKDNMSGKWSQFKHDLKSKAYDESKTEEEMISNIPDTRVDPSQFRTLVYHWCSNKGKEISSKNKRNPSHYDDLHCMGTKNLPRLIHEMDELKKYMGEAESSNDIDWKNDIYAKVKGPERRGRVRCLGKLPRQASSSVTSQSSNAEIRLQKLENLFGNLVSVLQTRFSEDSQINSILQAVVQEYSK